MTKLWNGWILGFLLSLFALGVNFFAYRVPDMLKIEFSRCAGQMEQHILLSDPHSSLNAYDLLKNNTIWDFVFLIGYTLVTIYSFRIIYKLFDSNTPLLVYILSVITGFFDSLENIALLTAGIRQREEYSSAFFYIVRIKWAFSLIPIWIFIVIAFYGLMVIFRNRKSDSLDVY